MERIEAIREINLARRNDSTILLRERIQQRRFLSYQNLRLTFDATKISVDESEGKLHGSATPRKLLRRLKLLARFCSSRRRFPFRFLSASRPSREVIYRCGSFIDDTEYNSFDAIESFCNFIGNLQIRKVVSEVSNEMSVRPIDKLETSRADNDDRRWVEG